LGLGLKALQEGLLLIQLALEVEDDLLLGDRSKALEHC
jgi:hypothetical protein